MVRRLLMVNIAGSRESTEITLRIAKMLSEIGTCAFNSRAAIPKPQIRLEKWLLSENDIS